MRKSSLLRLSFFLLIVFSFTPSTWAWIDTGHKIVAMIAWEEMTPKTRAAVTELLKQHPRYEKDLLPGAPADATEDQLARHAFAVSATWPDMVRNQNNPMHNTHNHPLWHYIDIPFENGATEPPAPASQPAGPNNVVEALAQCSSEI